MMEKRITKTKKELAAKTTPKSKKEKETIKENKTPKTTTRNQKTNTKEKTEEKQTDKKPKTKRKYTRDPNKLTPKEKKFIEAYLKHGNGTQASKDAGYNYKSDQVHGVNAHRLLKKDKIHQEIEKITAEMHSQAIASAQEVMEYFTKVMNGEILDQFGLEAPLSERTRAAQELAKRTVDWEARKSGQPDSVISVKLDFTGL